MARICYAAFEASYDDERMKHEMMLYHNDEATSWWQRHLPFAAKQSADLRIHKAIDKMVPAFASELTKVEIQPDKSKQTEWSLMLVEYLRRYVEAHEQADDEFKALVTTHYVVAYNFIA